MVRVEVEYVVGGVVWAVLRYERGGDVVGEAFATCRAGSFLAFYLASSLGLRSDGAGAL